MPAATPMLLSKNSQEGLVKYMELASLSLLSSTQLRDSLKYADFAYMRENDLTVAQWKARISNKIGDKQKIQNVIVPIVMPQVESSVETLAKIFCSKFPIFEFGSTPDKQNVALQYNTIMQENQLRGGWVRHLNMFFRDGLKYNIHALEVDWCEQKIWTVETDPNFQGGSVGKAKDILWAGNRITRMDMYNTFFDSRVAPAEVHQKGEFAGYVELMSRMELKRFVNSLPTKFVDNINPAFNSGIGGSGDGASTYSFYLPSLNPEALFTKSPQDAFDWMSWAGMQMVPGKVAYKNAYEVKTIYARLIPSDFLITVPSKNTPQIWKLVVVNNTVLIYAERQTNAHDLLPIIFGQPLEDGLRFQTKSFSKNLESFQDIASALWNERLASARRRLTDRAIYNPLLIRPEDVNSPIENAKIPLRNSMYGRKLEDAYHQIPYDDSNAQFFTQEADMIYKFSYLVSGKNNPSLGQFQKGNKNNPEWEQTMDNANSRDQGIARFMEDQVFTPVKEILKLNILQYQPSGEIYNTSEQKQVTVDPLTLRKTSLAFKVADGLLPIQKEMKTDELAVAFQTIQSAPQLQSGYNIVPMFSYIMKLRGLEGLDAFEKSPLQVQYEQAVASWQQVAVESIKVGEKPPAQPVMPPELIQELQAKQAAMTAKSASASPTPSSAQAPQSGAVAQGATLSSAPASNINIGAANGNTPQ
jgi:hypothetical protein